MNINKIKEDKYEIDERTLNLLLFLILLGNIFNH
nr:MAG TPA: hypothetical protein [Caudoviricetes sp.]